MNDFHCKKCGALVYHPARGDYDYRPESGLCRSCFLDETVKQMEAETEEYISKRRLIG